MLKEEDYKDLLYVMDEYIQKLRSLYNIRKGLRQDKIIISGIRDASYYKK